MQKEPVSVSDEGNQGRCFIYVEDLAEGNAAASKGPAENHIFNLAGAGFVTINQVIRILKEIYGEVKVEHKPSRPEDFMRARKSASRRPKGCRDGNQERSLTKV